MPFSNVNDNINSNDLLSAVTIEFDDSAVVELPIVDGAGNAILQFYLDDAELGAVGSSARIAKISESETRAPSPAEMTPGLQLSYMGIYEVRGIKNLKNVQFIGLQFGVNVKVDVSYFK